MNRCYRVLWSVVAQRFIVVSELARSRNKATTTTRRRRRHTASVAVLAAVAGLGLSGQALADGETSPIHVSGAGPEVSAAGVNIKATGTDNHAIHASSEAKVTSLSGKIEVTGTNASGLRASTEGSITSGGKVEIDTSGSNKSIGAYATSGGQIALEHGGHIKTTDPNANANAVRASGEDSLISITDMALESHSGNNRADLGATVRADSNGTVNLTDGTVTNDHDWGLGLWASSGGQITAKDTKISTTGKSGDSAGGSANHRTGVVFAYNGSGITLTGGTVETKGGGSHGLHAETGESAVEATGTKITTHGKNAVGAVANRDSSLTLEDVTITTLGTEAHGVALNTRDDDQGIDEDGEPFDKNSSGTRADIKGSTIKTSGLEANGVQVTGKGVVSIKDDSTITVNGRNARGLVADGDGATIESDGTTVHMTTNASNQPYGASAVNGGNITFDNGSIETGNTGSQAYALHADGDDSIISATGSEFKTSSGNVGRGQLGATVASKHGAEIQLVGGSVDNDAGSWGLGLWASSGGEISATGTDIKTTGTSGDGAGGSADHRTGAVFAYNGSRITLTDGSVDTEGDGSHGLHAETGESAVEATGTKITTRGKNAVGAVANRSGSLELDGVEITTAGEGAYGVGVELRSSGAQQSGATITGGSTITTKGKGANGLEIRAGGTADLTDSNVTTGNAAAAHVTGAGSRLAASDSTLTRQAGTDGAAALHVEDGAVAELTGGTIGNESTGNRAHGIWAEGAGSSVSIKGTDVHTRSSYTGFGETGAGALAQNGAQISIEGGSVASTAGANYSRALQAIDGGEITATDAVLSTEGDRSHGVQAYTTPGGGGLALTSAPGDSADGQEYRPFVVALIADPSEPAEPAATAISIHGGSVETQGYRSFGVFAQNEGSKVIVDNGTAITTAGDESHGAAADDGTLELEDVTILTQGAGAYGLHVDGDAEATVATSTISTQGDDAIGVNALQGDVTLTDSDVNTAMADYDYIQNETTAYGSIHVRGTVHARGAASLVAGTNSIDIGAGDTLFATGSNPANDNGSMMGTLKNAGAFHLADDTAPKSSPVRYTIRGDVQNNGGTIFFSNDEGGLDSASTVDATGVAGNELVVDGNFVANGGRMLMNTVLNDGHGNAQTDQLTVQGTVMLGEDGGPTQIFVQNAGGLGADTGAPDAIKLVDALESAEDAFALGSPVTAGAYEYTLQQGQSEGNESNWYLDSVYRGEPEPEPGPDAGPEPEPVHHANPEAGAYLANVRAAMGMFNMRLHDRMASPGYSENYDSGRNENAAWGRIVANGNKYRAAGDGLAVKGDSQVIQLGTDVVTRDVSSDAVAKAGVMAAYGQGDYDSTSRTTGTRFNAKIKDAFSVGVYGTLYEQGNGAYVDGWLQHAWFKNQIRADKGDQTRSEYDSRLLSASVEGGYTFTPKTFEDGRKLDVQPQAQVIYSRLHTDDFRSRTASSATETGARSFSNWQSRLGVRVKYARAAEQQEVFEPFAEVNWLHDTMGDGVSFNGQQRVATQFPHNRFELKLGGEGRISSRWSAWVNASYEFGKGHYRGYQGMAGLKMNW